MVSSLPPLGALRAFEAAARHENFSSAGEELFVTAGAVSRQIKALEHWAGVPLFHRHGKRVRLSEEGRRFAEAVAPAFDAIAAAGNALRASRAKRRMITINALPTFTMRWLLPRLSAFHRLAPEVELRLVTSDASIDSLAPQSFDVAIRRTHHPLAPGFTAKDFLEETERPVCAPSLLETAPVTAPADLARHTLLEAETRQGAWRRWLEEADAPETYERAAHQRFDHFYLTLQGAIDGLGFALGPFPLIAEEIDAGRLTAPLAAPEIAAPAYCWVCRTADAEDPAISALCRWLEAEGAS